MSLLGGKLFITGHQGLVGRALMRHYAGNPEWQIVTRTRAELDLRDQPATNAFFEAEKPDRVILAAATVGGIKASYTQPVDFLLNNLQIQNSVLSAAHRYDVKKLSRIWRGGPFHRRAGAGFPSSCAVSIKDVWVGVKSVMNAALLQVLSRHLSTRLTLTVNEDSERTTHVNSGS